MTGFAVGCLPMRLAAVVIGCEVPEGMAALTRQLEQQSPHALESAQRRMASDDDGQAASSAE